ncbi:uncharacterized protein VICG_01766 [Vittaforma corneae ATCC 50505]|uniref:Uncharacterized protein n=1 Tax=Vittaforma corneae (strain ATCC 50505) TaxID=993615 RepID=L2GLL5_VITCO|nr:uncharacterized protein VICG_01766 [Vittaforma corneae ATCC 50505]ELA41167.1 hypothetical protein VICG_01766 [Vittaforma corneae ATCC 50505]
MSKIESALTAYSNALNCHRLQYNLPTVGVRQKEFSSLLRLFLQRDLAVDPRNEKRDLLIHVILLLNSPFEFSENSKHEQHLFLLAGRIHRYISNNTSHILYLYIRMMSAPSNSDDRKINELSNAFISELKRLCSKLSAPRLTDN